MNKFLIHSLQLFLCSICLQSFAHSFSASGDFLIWHASEEPASTWANVITSDAFDTQNNDFGWSPGVRLGLSYEPDAFFDTEISWTYFSTDSSESIPFSNHVVAPGFFSGYVSGNFFFGALSDWNLTMNMFDIQASHEYALSQTLTLAPSIGIMGGTINQTIDTVWQAGIYDATEKVTSEFLGIGPSFGIAGKWNISSQFSLVSDLKAAFLWGRWNVSDVYTRPYVPISLTPDATQIKTELSDSELGSLMLDYFIGLQWTPQSFAQVEFQLGYELQYWANQLRLLAFQELPTHGDLTLQGGTCGVTIRF